MNDYGDSIENVCHRTGISGNCGEDCEAYMIYEECGFLEEAMENEQTKLVSNDVLLEDIKNTILEHGAYLKLIDGYEILAKLPENYDDPSYFRKQVYFTNLYSECSKFLHKLEKLANERGILYE